LATIDALYGGRVALGIGVGWMREEIEALNVDFTTRGARLDEWVEVLRQCWTGQPVGFSGSHYVLPPNVYAYPTPVRDIPLLVGGTSKAALRRAATVGGWFALYRPEEDPVARLAQDVVALRESAEACGQSSDIRIVLSVDAPDRVIEHLGHLAALGVTDITIEVGSLEAAERNYDLLADAAITA
jgi:alkanesulfonate monooxygenase SsuD/methylene tetrahydromethanopterin reductase-like flavin-dependent oxidoreductase (luciferase family)